MDQEVLVTGLRKLLRRLEEKEGSVALLMLLGSDNVDGGWNLVVSSRGFDAKQNADAVKQLTTWLRSDLARSLWNHVARVTVLRTQDPFVKAMTTAFRTEGSSLNLTSCNVMGVEIPKAIVLQSKRLAA